jgi:hypothetical protein
VPFKYDTLNDGGTHVFSAPLLKIVKWYHWGDLNDIKGAYYETKIYFFPSNLKDINTFKRSAIRLLTVAARARDMTI